MQERLSPAALTIQRAVRRRFSSRSILVELPATEPPAPEAPPEPQEPPPKNLWDLGSPVMNERREIAFSTSAMTHAPTFSLHFTPYMKVLHIRTSARSREGRSHHCEPCYFSGHTDHTTYVQLTMPSSCRHALILPPFCNHSYADFVAYLSRPQKCTHSRVLVAVRLARMEAALERLEQSYSIAGYAAISQLQRLLSERGVNEASAVDAALHRWR